MNVSCVSHYLGRRGSINVSMLREKNLIETQDRKQDLLEYNYYNRNSGKGLQQIDWFIKCTKYHLKV